MADSLKRIAAGAGAVIAMAMAGGPGVATAVADGSQLHVEAGQHGNHRPGQHRPGQHRPGDGQHPGEQEQPSRGPAEPVAPEVAGRPAPAAQPLDAAPEQTPEPTVFTPAAVQRGGSDISRVVARTPRPAPTATFGNGRTPTAPIIRPHRLATSVSPAVVQFPTPAPVSRGPQVAAPISRPAISRLVLTESPVPPESPAAVLAGPLAGVPPTGWPAGALFGIAGLLLAPIGGVWLGQRQARAARAASHLVSR